MFSHVQYAQSSSAQQQVAEFVLIEYPGVVKNVQTALDTLGGTKAISNAHFNNTTLELQLQPDNPFHSSMDAERHNQSAVFSGRATLVLRIRRRRKKPAGKGAATGAGEQLDIRCIGMEKVEFWEALNSISAKLKALNLGHLAKGEVSTIYSFRNICDFQFLPLSNTTTFDEAQSAPVHRDLVPHMVPFDFPSALSWWDEQQKQQQRHRKKLACDVKVAGGEEAATSSQGEQSSLELDVANYLPPYQFSRYNTPSKFILHDDVERLTKKTTTAGGAGHAKSLRNERRALTVTVNATDPFPKAPSEKALKDVNLRCKNAEVHQMLMELFAERPLWSRLAIAYRTRLTDAFLKIILAKYAFYISSGPWGRLWCRFGYDPRTDPMARCYQSIVVSFKKNQYIPERQRLRAAVSSAAGGTPQQQQGSPFYDYVYRPRVLPPLRQMWYCVCDVMLPIAQKMCRRDCLETLRECDPTDGWISADLIDAIRSAIKADVAMSSARMGEDDEGGGSGGGGPISVGGGEISEEDEQDMTMMEDLEEDDGEEEEMDEDDERIGRGI